LNHDLAPDRRHSLRQRVNTPAFASFDGVTGGMILDLSEEGMAMQSQDPIEAHSIVPLHLSLGEPTAYLETTGYVAWADALGRAGVRFSELPDKSRERLRDWLTANAYAPSWKAPRWVVRDSVFAGDSNPSATATMGVALNLDADPEGDEESLPSLVAPVSTTVQYEFKSLTGDLDAALNLIASRACSITRGTGAAVALIDDTGMTCRAVAGTNVPPIGALVDVENGFTGECVRAGRGLRCDNADSDPRVDAEACRRLGIRSILAAPVLYERDLVGLVEVFAVWPYAFDEGDLAVVERLAQTVVSTLSRAEVFQEVAGDRLPVASETRQVR
jgi:hypothetical protein